MKQVSHKKISSKILLKDLSRKIDRFKSDVDFNLKDLRTKLSLFQTKVSFDTRSLQNDIKEYDKKNEKRFDKAMTHLVDIAGKFEKFDQEHTLLTRSVSNHEDRIDKLEETVLKTS